MCVCGPSSLQESSFPVVSRRGRRAGTLVPGCVEEGEESRDPRSRLCGGGGGEQGPSFPVVWRRGRRAGTLVPGCVEEGEESRDLVHTACTVRVVHVGVEHHSAAAPVYITRCLVAVVV